jgi:hypothetical protein
MADRSETEKHNLKFDRPHVYICSCGFVVYLHPDGTENIAEEPKGKIEYLPCGHAACAKTEQFDCIICVKTGGSNSSEKQVL